jgi:molybdopterin/thiamine biosynthesis adenylyltransferase
MKESKVLVINLTGAVTELIRHLVLSGINLEIVNDGKIVEASHADEDFLIDAQTDLGKYVIS